jgi:hypothetical protein
MVGRIESQQQKHFEVLWPREGKEILYVRWQPLELPDLRLPGEVCILF